MPRAMARAAAWLNRLIPESPAASCLATQGVEVIAICGSPRWGQGQRLLPPIDEGRNSIEALLTHLTWARRVRRTPSVWCRMFPAAHGNQTYGLGRGVVS